ncbi:hypothetical protein AB1A65_00505 [Muricauda sp. ANG21]|uniref:hypothetical protein n=1 Tax=Allomuricauda sp. ANG21 TaxID=3042468 RepID=UPI0034524A27
MKKQIVFLIAALLAITSLQAQVKIGDNPQSIHPASVLELQSNNRVLVITRVTDAQMSTINPLRGAMVYNTDAECIHYFNGTEWINICEELDNSFTVSTEAVFNIASRDSTVVVTQTETPDGINYNFEVDKITGENIRNFSIFRNNLTLGIIGQPQLQDGAVSLPKLEDGTIAGQLIQWNGTEWVLISEADITITEIDGVIGNEVTDATAGGSLQRNGGGTDVDPWTLDVVDGGINTDELATDAVTSDKILDGTIATLDLDDDIITNAKMATDAVGSLEIINGAVTLAKIVDGTAAGELMQWNGTDWVLVDPSTLTVTEADGIVGNEVTNATDGTLTRSGAGSLADPYTLGVSPNGISDNEIANDAVTLAKIANGTTAGELMQWNGTDWVLVDPSTLTVTEADGIIGNEITNATDGTLLRSGTGTLADPYTLDVNLLGIDTAELANNAVNSAKIEDGQVQTNDIADANVTPIKVAPSATNGDILTTVGGAVTWQAPAVVAMGKVDVTATAENANGASVVRNSAGNYTVTFDVARLDPDYIVQLTLLNAGPDVTIEVTGAPTTNDFTVQISDTVGAPIDAQWYFTVTDF